MVKKCYIYIILLSLFLINTSTGFAHIFEELSFIKKNNPIPIPEKKEQLSPAFKKTSEAKLVFIGMIRFYQLFISSQQNNREICIFTPSCSQFGFEAINNYGVFHGILMTSDRLQRCHGFGKRPYTIDQKTGKFTDAVERYALKKEKFPPTISKKRIIGNPLDGD